MVYADIQTIYLVNYMDFADLDSGPRGKWFRGFAHSQKRECKGSQEARTDLNGGRENKLYIMRRRQSC